MGDFLFEEANQPLKHPVEKIPNKYQDYLQYSKMRNPKLIQPNKNNKVIQLEEGFSLYFNGANSELCDKKEKATAVAPRKSKTCEERGKMQTDRSKSTIERQTWGSATKLGFLTERGDRLFVKPHNYYSEDFEEVEEIKEIKQEDEEEDGEEEIEEEISGLSVDLSINDMRSLRRSLVMKNEVGGDRWQQGGGLERIREDEEKIVTLELRLGDGDPMLGTARKAGNTTRTARTAGNTARFTTRDTLGYTEQAMVEGDSEQRLKDIIERVLRMNVVQQQKLLSSLENIETTLEHQQTTEELEVSLVIEENWGHPSRVGLTEVEFSDGDKRPIKVSRVSASDDVEGKLENLVNEKRDTSKEKQMWSSRFSVGQSVRINFYLVTSSVDEVKFVTIWNFNKSLDSLSIGVKKFSLLAAEKIVCTGFVEKALGNAVFNPPTIIEVKKEEEKRLSFSSGSLDFSSDDDECLMDKFQNALQNRTFRLEDRREKKDEPIIEESSSRKGSARFGRRSEMEMSEGGDILKELIAEFEGGNKLESLEKSWSSLKFFNKSQAGRLSLDYTGDILDTYVNQIRRDKTDRTEKEDSSGSEEEFVIPELPQGREMQLNILSTWGDPHYVGLTGIEMFAASGERVPVKTITADPPDINILPGYGSDPRVVKNLLDGVNKTRDDVHMWLAPFTAHRNHFISIGFQQDVQLALLRIWNYNKSRIHSSRGAREVEITLDGSMIFRGEIARVADSNDIEEYGEVILFTSDDTILDRIGQNDQEFVDCNNNNSNEEDLQSNDLLASLVMRPPTAKETVTIENKTSSTRINNATRPFTSTRHANVSVGKKVSSVIKMVLAETWGDEFYIGLTGLEIIDGEGNVVPVDLETITTNMDALDDDVRQLQNVFDGSNVTTEDEHMWLAPFTAGDEHSLLLTVHSKSRVASIRVWNYNKSLEDSYRGVKCLHIYIDGKQISPEDGFFLRRAPGHFQYDFVQEIKIGDKIKVQEDLGQYRHLPCGFVYQFNIFSAWNDLYYVGLNGFELYDQCGRRIEVNTHQVYACPDSVNSLTPKDQRSYNSLDVRTPDKLVDGVNDTYDPKHMWLAPILPGCLNKIFIVFDHPVALSMIHIWNYSKSPSRGVKDFSILVDDLLIHSGTLPSATSASIARGILPNMNDAIAPSNPHKTVLFDKTNPSLLAQERLNLLEHSVSNGQDVVLINDSDVNSNQFANPKFRPKTSVNSRPKLK